MSRKFPARIVVILSLCATLNSYTLVNLFPYAGLMVKELLALETTNELGELVRTLSGLPFLTKRLSRNG